MNPVIRVGTAMIAAQAESFFMTMFSRTSASDRLVSYSEDSTSRWPSRMSAAWATWSVHIGELAL